MKTRNLLLGAMGLLLMASCSKDEVVSVQKDEIGYDVAVNTLTRAADSYCNVNLPSNFRVWAKTSDNKLFIKNDMVTNIDGIWTDVTATHYWPANDLTIDFYAQKNGDVSFNFNDGAPSFNDFVVKDNVTQQVDLIYAVHKGQAKAEKVQINFRHALSQVCFRAINRMKGAEVIINSVSMGHLTNKGTFTFPTSSTDTNYESAHNDVVESEVPELNSGNWEIPNDAQYNKVYTVKPLLQHESGGSATLMPNMGLIADLTGAMGDHGRGFSQVLTLLPQKVAAWNPEIKGTNATDWNGAYFLLDLVINNVVREGNEFIKTLIYDGEVAIPVAVDWKPGYRYIYTFAFNEGSNGGYTPDPSNPKPVLSSIEYKVTVDDYISASGDGSDDTPMETKKYTTIAKLHSNYIDYTDANDCFNPDAVEVVEDVQLNSYTTSSFFTPDYTPTREGFNFLGWATTPDATAAEYNYSNPTINVNMEQATLDLYAVWSPINFCWRFHFGGKDLSGQQVPAGWGPVTNNEYWGGEVNQRQIGGYAPVAEGYTFKGYKIVSSINGLRDGLHQPLDFITLDVNDPVLHFYAEWEENAPEASETEGN